MSLASRPGNGATDRGIEALRERIETKAEELNEKLKMRDKVMTEFNIFRKCIDILLTDSLLLLLVSGNTVSQGHLARYKNTFKETVSENSFSSYSEKIGEFAILQMDSTADLHKRISSLSDVLHTRTSFFNWGESNPERAIDSHIDYEVEPYGNVEEYPTDLRVLLECLDSL